MKLHKLDTVPLCVEVREREYVCMHKCLLTFRSSCQHAIKLSSVKCVCVCCEICFPIRRCYVELSFESVWKSLLIDVRVGFQSQNVLKWKVYGKSITIILYIRTKVMVGPTTGNVICVKHLTCPFHTQLNAFPVRNIFLGEEEKRRPLLILYYQRHVKFVFVSGRSLQINNIDRKQIRMLLLLNIRLKHPVSKMCWRYISGDALPSLALW